MEKEKPLLNENGNLYMDLTVMETGRYCRWYLSVENGKLTFTDSNIPPFEEDSETVSLFQTILLFIR